MDAILKIYMPNHLQKGIWEHYAAASISRYVTILYLLEWKVMPITQRLLKVTVMKLILYQFYIHLNYGSFCVDNFGLICWQWACQNEIHPHYFYVIALTLSWTVQPSAACLCCLLSFCQDVLEGLNASVKEIQWLCMIHLWIHNLTRF